VRNELARPDRLSRLLTAAAAIGGYAFFAVLLSQGFASGQWPFPGGDVVAFYARAGDALRSGSMVYFHGFLYSPPWAVAFASLSWLGPAAIHIVILVLDGVALWTIAGRNLKRLGYLLWFPLIPFEVAAGQLNLIIAGAIVAAQHGRTWPLAAVSLAKVWPAAALPIRDLASFARAFLLFAALSLPWFHLWPEWIAALIVTSAHPLGPVVPIPFIYRAAVALALVAAARPWTRALAASIVSPGLYWGQLVVLVAPLALWLESRRESAAASKPPDQGPQSPLERDAVPVEIVR
jgi:hypothetical protein